MPRNIRQATPEEEKEISHEQSTAEMAAIRANPDAQHNLPLQLRGSAPQMEMTNPNLRARGTGGLPTEAPAANVGLRARGSAPAPDEGPPDEAPSAEAHAKGGIVGDTKPRYKGVIHKGG